MEKKIAIIREDEMVKANIPTAQGFYRPLFYGGAIAYQLDEKELVCSEPMGELLTSQIFTFSYKENGKEMAKGWFGLNGYTGKAHVETVPSISLHSFQALRSLIDSVKQFVYDAVDTMGTLCYRAYTNKANKEVKPEKKFSGAHTLFVANANTVEFTPSVVDVLPQAKAAQGVVRRRSETVFRSSIAEVKTLSWSRRGCWCTSKLGNRYWRKGGVCKRHL